MRDPQPLAVDLIIYTAASFGLFALAMPTSTGSSLMAAEKRIRTRSNCCAGKSAAFFLWADDGADDSAARGLPTAYNKDLQEDTEPLFFFEPRLRVSMPLVADRLWRVSTLAVNQLPMRAALSPRCFATDLAGTCTQGCAFTANHTTLPVTAVRMAEVQGVVLPELALEDLQTLSQKAFDDRCGHSLEL
jgi:argininosuccinate lyase